MILKQFGGRVTKQHTAQYQQSENWKNGQFHNLEVVSLTPSLWKIPQILYKQLRNMKGREPKQPLPVIPFDKTAFEAPSDKAKMIWYGHSVVFLRMNETNILIDPMLGPDTTPIAPIPTNRFSKNTLNLIDDFPTIDLVLLTHDHYDHLDYASIQKLKSKTKQFVVSLGVKRHLVSWGVDANLIQEVDWWNTFNINGITITFTPTQHFSGRGLTDRQKTMWGGWALNNGIENIWFSGDGGYNTHFKIIGERLEPFDFAFMECGQYNEDWHDVHLFPDESVQAAIDANVKKAMPVHWGGFPLSYQHTWKEPVEDFIKAAKQLQMNYTTPSLGKIFTVDSVEQETWWRDFE